MVIIKSFSRKINRDSSQDECDLIDGKINDFLINHNIHYDEIKRFDITTLETHPNTGGSSYAKEGSVYLIYTIIIEKFDGI